MSSSSMPPPPLPLAHRRTHRIVTSQLPPSPPCSPDSTSCVPRKMSLSKGATFHYPSSSPTEDDPSLSIRHLARRSPTCSQSVLASWLSEKKDIVQSLSDFEQTFSGARGKRISSRRRSAQDFEQQLRLHRASSPLDEGLGSSISSTTDKGLSQTLERALDFLSDKDSGLGTSIGDLKTVNNSEDDGLVKDLIQETDSPKPATPRTRQRGTQTSNNPTITTPSAVTQSIAPPTSRRAQRHPPLSSTARKTISRNIITPILQEDRYSDLHSLVTSLGSKSNKGVRCLRDLEQSLIFQPLVSAIFTNIKTRSDPFDLKTLAITQHLYRGFAEFTIQLVVDTYHQLSEQDQRRAADRPYDNGYFLDLVQQVGRLAAQIGTSRQAQQAGTVEEGEMSYSPEDEVTLEGGLGQTGDVAELVRWKDGKGISLRTGLPYEPTPGIKRQSTEDLEEDAARSMARRKKGYIPELIEMKCSDPTCGKIFNRKCDLAKHEKTHSRPFKCPDRDCKYHELGLPTEKERDRHVNDKHDPNPHFYKCKFCEFRTKRESNCKQHQEKKHNWHYERAKGKDKVVGKMTPAQTPQTPSMDYSPSLQSPAQSYRSSHWDDGSSIAGSIPGSTHLTPFEQPMNDFGTFDHSTMYSAPLFPRNNFQQPMQYVQANDTIGFQTPAFNQGYHPQAGAYISPPTTTPMTPSMMHTPNTPAYSHITGQSPYLTNMDITMDCNPQQWESGLPTPGSLLQTHSRDPSISHQSPLYPVDSFNDPMIGQSMDLPDNDFSLFDGNNHSPFSNPAAANATLFPASDFAVLDNDPLFEDEGAFVDYDTMMN